jgi:hypothetical protein
MRYVFSKTSRPSACPTSGNERPHWGACPACSAACSNRSIQRSAAPSDRFARYDFDVRVSRALSAQERRQLRVLVSYLKPAYTHFVGLLEPLPPPVLKHGELGLSDLDDTSFPR